MDFFQKTIRIWQNISLVQKALLLAILFTFIIAGGLLTHWASRPDMRMLYQDLEPEEASKIVDKLSEKGIPYEIRSGGSSIFVPRQNVYQSRLDMAREGLPGGSQSGYRIFDSEKIGVSPFVQNVNFKRALQDELARSIQVIDGVQHARVHIVDSERSLFTKDKQETTASVVLQLRPGFRPGNINISAITYMIAGSVKDLKSENVTVIDSQGRLLTQNNEEGFNNGANSVADYRDRVEQNLARKAEDMLTAVLGPGRASVRVSAVVNMTSESQIVERYDPTNRVVLREEIKSNTEEDSAILDENANKVPGGNRQDEEILTEYALSKTVEQRTAAPGNIESLTVAAFVDLNSADPNSTALIMPIEDVESVIKNAIGLKESDSLKVVNARFHRPAEQTIIEPDEDAKWAKYIVFVRHGSLGIMAICALLVLKILGGGKPKSTAPAIAQNQLQAGETAGLLGSGNEGGSESEPMMLRRQIASALQQNPDQVKQLFSNWIEEG